MRKLLRQMAKEQARKLGATKVNKAIGNGRWRQLVNAYPINRLTGKEMGKNYHGRKHYRKGSRANNLFFYNFRFVEIQKRSFDILTGNIKDRRA